MKLRSNGSKDFFPEEIQKMTATFNSSDDLQFTAGKFFKISYSMLCAMVGTIISYLIILIQFYSLYSKNNKGKFVQKNCNSP
jgi:hypothetical protein